MTAGALVGCNVVCRLVKTFFKLNGMKSVFPNVFLSLVSHRQFVLTIKLTKILILGQESSNYNGDSDIWGWFLFRASLLDD